MIKYLIVVNSEPKMYYYGDEYDDAVNAIRYCKQFYKDAKLYSLKFSAKDRVIYLEECKGV